MPKVSSLTSFVLDPSQLHSQDLTSYTEGVTPTLTKDLGPDMDFPDDPTVSAGLKYHASKLLAHHATLDWVQANNPHYNVITLHPSFVFGHSLIQTSTENADPLNKMLWASLSSEKPQIPSSGVDVKDVAAAHLKALDLKVGENSEVQEFLLSGAGWRWDRVVDFVNEKYPNLGIKMTGPFAEDWKVETKRAEELLGVEWTPVEDTVADVLDQQLRFRS
jgi:nucleoside-diphosphate-sugar epimerase